jgi:hypothetical protein
MGKKNWKIVFERSERIGYTTTIEAETAEEALELFNNDADCDWEEKSCESESGTEAVQVKGWYPLEGGPLTRIDGS